MVLDRSVPGPVPQWLEELATQGHASAKGLVLLFPGKRFARLGDAQAALDQAREEGAGGQVLGDYL